MNSLGDGRFGKSIFAREPILTTERRIWRGVLYQAYADAELPLSADSEDELFIDQIRARRFLRADAPEEEEGLRLVCDYAEVPFDRLVKWARKRYPPLTQQELKKAEARDAKDVEEIVKAVKNREAAILALSKFASALTLLPSSSPLLQ